MITDINDRQSLRCGFLGNCRDAQRLPYHHAPLHQYKEAEEEVDPEIYDLDDEKAAGEEDTASLIDLVPRQFFLHSSGTLLGNCREGQSQPAYEPEERYYLTEEVEEEAAEEEEEEWIVVD